MQELEQVYKNGDIEMEQYDSIQSFESTKLFSIHWELRTILYLGVLLFSSGIGILIYLNINTIGHQAVLAAVFLAFCGCFYYINKHKLPYSNEQVIYASPFFDYVVLLGALLFGIFASYLQYQYTVFGNHYGALVFIPTLLYFYLAYRFDHKGVLSMAISGLASSLGLSVAPYYLLNGYGFSNPSVILTSLLLGVLLVVWAIFSIKKGLEKHFDFTYNNFALNILLVAVCSALFNLDYKFLSLLLILGVCVYFVKYAIEHRSYLFLLLSVLYGYVSLTYFVFYLISKLDTVNENVVFLGMLYVILSAIGAILFFVNIKKILKK